MARPWERHEFILTLNHYFTRPQSLTKRDTDVQELARKLNRTPDSIELRFMNYRARDPEQRAAGKAGMRGGGRAVDSIWNEFSLRRSDLEREATAAEIGLDSLTEESEIIAEVEENQSEEGSKILWNHIRRERNRKLVKCTKRRFLKPHGMLFCEACRMTFEDRYGTNMPECFEVHHGKPLSQLQPGETTRIEDMHVLCPTCHRVIHKSHPWITVDELKIALNSKE